MKKSILFLFIFSLILTACHPAPQVTVTLPPPTEPPALTPTPIAADGIAENAEGDKLAYLDGKWTLLPALDGGYKLVAVWMACGRWMKTTR